MAAGTNIETKNILIKYTMSKDAAELIYKKFCERSMKDQSLSYMDCVLFDSALEVLGIEQEYYGIGQEDWERTLKERKEEEKRFDEIKTIDVTDTWHEVMD